MALTQHDKNGLIYFTSPQIPVPHGFSTRRGGVSLPPYDSLDLGPNRGDDPAAVLENSRRFYHSHRQQVMAAACNPRAVPIFR